jgi:serine/threonine protein kinase
VLMYELLTGRVPFGGDNWMAVMAGHLGEHPKPIADLRPDVPPALAAVVTHAMRRYPEHRYQTMTEVLHDLDHLDEIDPKSFDQTPEPSMGGMAAVTSERRLWALVALVAVSFLGLVGVIITLSIVLR